MKIAGIGYYVEMLKIKGGSQIIPMSEKVLEAFQRILNKHYFVIQKSAVTKSVIILEKFKDVKGRTAY